MKVIEEVYDEFNLESIYTPWGSADYNYKRIKESGQLERLMLDLDEIYTNGLTIATLNDILWFDDEFCYQYIHDELLSYEEQQIKEQYIN